MIDLNDPTTWEPFNPEHYRVTGPYGDAICMRRMMSGERPRTCSYRRYRLMVELGRWIPRQLDVIERDGKLVAVTRSVRMAGRGEALVKAREARWKNKARLAERHMRPPQERGQSGFESQAGHQKRKPLPFELDRNTVVYGPYSAKRAGLYVQLAHYGMHEIVRFNLTFRQFSLRSIGKEFKWAKPPTQETLDLMEKHRNG